MRPNDRTIQTFDPLLRDLITWGLVERHEQGWALSERSQRRLAELAESSAPWPAEQTVYFGHRCEGCDTRALTRLRDGVYVCDSCWSRRGSEEPRAGTVPARRPRLLLRRNVHIA